MTRRSATRRSSPGRAPAGATRFAEGPNPKQPCPCGSGRRYKACHGGGSMPPVARPFEGIASECDWVAMRELVPSATARLTLADPKYAAKAVFVATVLPMALPALVRTNGQVLVGLQTQVPSTDPSREVAYALVRALDAGPGVMLPYVTAPRNAPRLSDLLTDDPLEITVHDDFAFWIEGNDSPPEDVTTSMERANETVMPTVRLAGLESAYWCLPGDKAHLRWVLPYEEEALLDGLARLSAAGEIGLGEGTRFAGSFRAHGLLVPVWDLPIDVPADAWVEPAAALHERLADAMAGQAGLDDAERRARAGLRGRQLTIR